MVQVQDRVHPIEAVVSRVRAGLSSVAEVDPMFMSAEDQRATLRDLLAVRAQVDELMARVLVGVDQAGVVVREAAVQDLPFWWAQQTRLGVPAAREEIGFARQLAGHPVTAAAMRAGVVSGRQARVVMAAVDALPTDLPVKLVEDLAALDEAGVDVAARAEAHLIRDAERFGPQELTLLGRRILEVVAPEIAEEAEARKLEAAERRAWAQVRLTLRSLGDGTTRVSGRVPDLAANQLLTMLDSLLSPRRTPGWVAQASTASTASATGAAGAAGEGAGGCEASDVEAEAVGTAGVQPRPWWDRPTAEKLGEAFVEWVERYPSDVLPVHGNTATTVFVTMTLDQLQSGLGAVVVQGPRGGDLISAGEARRLACGSNLIPAVLGARGEVLDLGRQSRLFSSAQTRALRLRHRQCQGTGCVRPAAHCEAHHDRAWVEGGPTDLANALLLCSRCHHRAHDPQVTYRVTPAGEVVFSAREGPP